MNAINFGIGSIGSRPGTFRSPDGAGGTATLPQNPPTPAFSNKALQNAWARFEQDKVAFVIGKETSDLIGTLKTLIPRNAVGSEAVTPYIEFFEDYILSYIVDEAIGNEGNEDDLRFALLAAAFKVVELLLLQGRALLGKSKSAAANEVFLRAQNIMLAYYGGTQTTVDGTPANETRLIKAIKAIMAAKNGRGTLAQDGLDKLRVSFDSNFVNGLSSWGYDDRRLNWLLAGAYKHSGQFGLALQLYNGSVLKDVDAGSWRAVSANWYDHMAESTLSVIEIKLKQNDSAGARAAAEAARVHYDLNAQQNNTRIPIFQDFERFVGLLKDVYRSNREVAAADTLQTAWDTAKVAGAELTAEQYEALLLAMGFTKAQHPNLFDCFTRSPLRFQNLAFAKAQFMRSATAAARSNILSPTEKALNDLKAALNAGDAEALKMVIANLVKIIKDNSAGDDSDSNKTIYDAASLLIWAFNSPLYERKIARPANVSGKGRNMAAALSAALLGDTVLKGICGLASSEIAAVVAGQGYLRGADISLAAVKKGAGNAKKGQEANSLASALQALKQCAAAKDIYQWLINNSAAYKTEATLGKAECNLELLAAEKKSKGLTAARRLVMAQEIEQTIIAEINGLSSVRAKVALGWAYTLQYELQKNEMTKAAINEILGKAAERYKGMAEGQAAATDSDLQQCDLTRSDVYYRLGEAQKNMGAFGDAIESFNRVEQVGLRERSYWLARLGRAEALLGRGLQTGSDSDIADAVSAANAILGTDGMPQPADTDAAAKLAADDVYCRVGEVLKNAKRYDEAISAYAKVLPASEPPASELYDRAQVGMAETYIALAKDKTQAPAEREKKDEQAEKIAWETFNRISVREAFTLEETDVLLRSVYVLSGVCGYRAEQAEASLDPAKYKTAADEWKKLLAVFAAVLGDEKTQAMINAVAPEAQTFFSEAMSAAQADGELWEALSKLRSALPAPQFGQFCANLEAKLDAKMYFTFGEIFKAASKEKPETAGWAAGFYEMAMKTAEAEANPALKTKAQVALAEVEIIDAKQAAKKATAEADYRAAQGKIGEAIKELTQVLAQWNNLNIPDGADKNALLANTLILLSWAYSSQADIEKNYDETAAQADFLKAATVYQKLLNAPVFTGVAADLFQGIGLPDFNPLTEASVLAAISYTKEELQLNYAGLLKVCGEENEEILTEAQTQYGKILESDNLRQSNPELFFAASAGLAETYVYQARLSETAGIDSAPEYTLAIGVCKDALAFVPVFATRKEVAAVMDIVRVFAWAQGDVLQNAEKDNPFKRHGADARIVAGLNLLLADPSLNDAANNLGLSEIISGIDWASLSIQDFVQAWQTNYPQFVQAGIFNDSAVNNEQVLLNAANALVIAEEFESAEKILLYVCKQASGALQAEAYLALGDLYCWHDFGGKNRYIEAQKQYAEAQRLADALPGTEKKKDIEFNAAMGEAQCLYELEDFTSTLTKLDVAIAMARQTLAAAQQVSSPDAKEILTAQKQLLRALDAKRNLYLWAKDGAKFHYTEKADQKIAIDLDAEIRKNLGDLKADRPSLFERDALQYESELPKLEILLEISALDQRAYRAHEYGQPSEVKIFQRPTFPIIAEYEAQAAKIYDPMLPDDADWLLKDKAAPKLMAQIKMAEGFVYADMGDPVAAKDCYDEALKFLKMLAAGDAGRADLLRTIIGSRGESENNAVDSQNIKVGAEKIMSHAENLLFNSVDIFNGWRINVATQPWPKWQFGASAKYGDFRRDSQLSNGAWLFSRDGGEVAANAEWMPLLGWHGQYKYSLKVKADMTASWLNFDIFQDYTYKPGTTDDYSFNSYLPKAEAEGSLTMPSKNEGLFFITASGGAGAGLPIFQGSPFSNDLVDTSILKADFDFYAQSFLTLKTRRQIFPFGIGSSATLGYRLSRDFVNKTWQGFYLPIGSMWDQGITLSLIDRFYLGPVLFEAAGSVKIPTSKPSSLYRSLKFSVINPQSSATGGSPWWQLLPDRAFIEGQMSNDGVFPGQPTINTGDQVSLGLQWGF
ncbi:MAG: hypothetical protein WC636_00840 [Candidatus Margulisiibacteriota bacterium]